MHIAFYAALRTLLHTMMEAVLIRLVNSDGNMPVSKANAGHRLCAEIKWKGYPVVPVTVGV